MLTIFFLLNVIIGYKELYKYEKNQILYILLLIFSIFLYDFKILYFLYPLLLSQILIDFKYRELSNLNSLCIFLEGIIYLLTNSFNINFISLFIMGIFYFILSIPSKGIGFGDVKLILALSIFVSLMKLSMFLFYPFLFGIFLGFFYKIILKQEHFPFGPAIILTFILINLI